MNKKYFEKTDRFDEICVTSEEDKLKICMSDVDDNLVWMKFTDIEVENIISSLQTYLKDKRNE